MISGSLFRRTLWRLRTIGAALPLILRERDFDRLRAVVPRWRERDSLTALALRALAFAERYGVTIAVVAGDRLCWQSRGPTPGRALDALKVAKRELIDLLVHYRLDSAGGLAGDDLLAALQVAAFAVRR